MPIFIQVKYVFRAYKRLGCVTFQLLCYVNMTGIGWLWVMIGYFTECVYCSTFTEAIVCKNNFFVFCFLGYIARLLLCVIMEIASLHLKK